MEDTTGLLVDAEEQQHVKAALPTGGATIWRRLATASVLLLLGAVVHCILHWGAGPVVEDRVSAVVQLDESPPADQWEELVVNGIKIHMVKDAPKPTHPKMDMPVKLRAAPVGSRKDWMLRAPNIWTSADIDKLVAELPDGVQLLFKGQPPSGLSSIGVRASFEDLKHILEKHPELKHVEQSVEFHVPVDVESVKSRRLVKGTQRIESDLFWSLDRIDQRDLPLDKHFSYANGGQGIHVYIFDTGIMTTNPEFEGRAIPTLDAARDDDRPIECSPTETECARDMRGHGTHVAGTVGGKTYGVAKNVTLHAVKVLDDSNKGYWWWWIQAMDWVLVHAQRPAIIQSSIGSTGNSYEMKYAVQKAEAAGITVVVSAGNDNSDACTYTPCFVPEAICVGATTSSDDRSSFSNFGECVDIFAPGSSILSAGLGSDTFDWGTSMAAPHVSGVVALMLGNNPVLTPAEVRGHLLEQATRGKVQDAGAHSPNYLLFAPDVFPPLKDTTTAEPKKLCSDHGPNNCLATKCCNNPAHICFQKNEAWASCMSTCKPGVNPLDPQQHRTPWRCRPISTLTMPHDSDLIYFKSFHGNFVAAERDGGAVKADRPSPGDWEKFFVVDNADRTKSFKSFHGRHLAAEQDGTLLANRGAISAWEKFTWVTNADGTVSVKAHNGKYWRAMPNGQIKADASSIGGWEKFWVQRA